ncbi:Predicted ATPase [Gemmobacter megaterium]|uniref:Predicted ATPase n=1 Tax=Gemmobacter megaterium TaxID=1086013 RepID=A0A1N7NWE2_9RHOB|nr:AAA family ATPase [Gemmobacter megaterium]GGE16233.1 ATP-binding protein [Gemmobacter megaterium]SIT02640.1 Predicted ATPase [Gemmobacter megaterium]
MILTLAVSGYRSLRDIVLPLDRLTVVTGANGTGKSSLYRALRLLAEVAQGRAIGSLAAEGGLGSTLWAGPETISRAMHRGEVAVQGTVRKDRVALKLGFAADDYGYAVDLGLPVAGASAFAQDPEIKTEAVWVGECLNRHNVIAERTNTLVRARGDKGAWLHLATGLPPYDSMMTHAADAATAPELLTLRDRMRAWRFYDHLRTDREAPARRARVGTRTPVLAGDGADLAAAIQTIREVGDHVAFDTAIADAFPGALVEVVRNEALFAVQMRQHGLLRPLGAAELSDGTLRFLLLAAALLTPRPPELMVLNEPETSLHPDLIAPLARLIAAAARTSQLVVVSHSAALAAALDAEGALTHDLRKATGETVIDGHAPPPWAWPKR